MARSRNQPLFQIAPAAMQSLSALRFLEPLLEGEPDSIAELFLAHHINEAFAGRGDNPTDVQLTRKEITELNSRTPWEAAQFLEEDFALSVFPDFSVILSWQNQGKHTLCPIPARINKEAFADCIIRHLDKKKTLENAQRIVANVSTFARGRFPEIDRITDQGGIDPTKKPGWREFRLVMSGLLLSLEDGYGATTITNGPRCDNIAARQKLYDEAKIFLDACKGLKILSRNPLQDKLYFSPLTAHRSRFCNTFEGKKGNMSLRRILAVELAAFIETQPALHNEGVYVFLKSRLPDRSGVYGNIGVHLLSKGAKVSDAHQADFRNIALSHINSPLLGLFPMDQIYTEIRIDTKPFRPGNSVIEAQGLTTILPEKPESAHERLELHRTRAEFRKTYWTDHDQSQSDHPAEDAGNTQ